MLARLDHESGPFLAISLAAGLAPCQRATEMEKDVLETLYLIQFHNCGNRQVHPMGNIVNRNYLLYSYYMPGTLLSVLYVISHLILITNV